jgi:hypothetical protein
MIRHGATDSLPGQDIGKWRIPKEWIPVVAMLIWCLVFWKNERLYAHAGLVRALIGFVYGFTPYIIKN